jgi:tetratricopeptide (TPR) repeat protein/transcriptional regulator with XRE-family HTH domain
MRIIQADRRTFTGHFDEDSGSTMAPDSGAASSTDGPALAALLRAWRERALLTQEQLAERTGLSVRTIRRLEASRMRPRSGSVRQLADALGLGDTERTLLTAAARGRPAQPTPAALCIPRQLPPDVAGFTGRACDLERLDALLAGADTPPAVVISAIAGTAGVGKTALAIHWAHQVADRFPDGQLHVNLHGYAPGPPVSPLQALAQLLNGLGLPADQIPVDQEATAGLYRSLLAGKRILVVLDNARHAEQIRPLLPGTSGCLVVVTSRDRLTGLVATHGAHRITLDVLTPGEAVALLGRILGKDRVAAEPEAAAELAEACAFLPLALRIAAAELTGQAGQPIAGYAAGLREQDRLAALEIDGDPQAAVRVAFDSSYTTLAAETQRLFRLLGLVPGPEVSVPAAAALAGITPEQAAALLARLADGHLLKVRTPGRFAFHDLLRRYALQRTEHEDDQHERQAATRRLFDWYLHATDAAARLLDPMMFRLPLPPATAGLPSAGFDRYADALAWMDNERANLVAAVEHAARYGPMPLAWQLADALRGYLVLRRHMLDWLAVANAGLAAAASADDQQAQATAHFSLGLAHWSLGRYPQAVEHYTIALELFRRTGWLHGQAATVANLGVVHTDVGSLQQAASHLTQALALERASRRADLQATTLSGLGLVNRELGRLADAANYQTQALALCRQTGSRGGEAYALNNIAEVDHDRGKLDHAQRYLTHALALYQEVGNRSGEAYALHALAAVHRDAGRHAQALKLAQAAVALAREMSERRAHVEALNTLGSVQLRLADFREATSHHQHALDLAGQAGIRYAETGALLGLAAADHAREEHDQAIEHAQRALAMASQVGYRVLEGHAHAILAAAHHAQQDHEQAAEHAREALALHRDTGHRLGEARTLITLGHTQHSTCAADAAVASWQEALALLTSIGAPEAEDVRALLHLAAGA